ncbi:hypothetical protein Q7P37_009794 [Cladosporium fusiforme]
MDIFRTDLSKFDASPNTTIADLKHLASYSWIEASSPTITVPGLPRRWSKEITPRQLQKDSGLVYIAQNAARLPESPLEPLFRALYTSNPLFDMSSTDIVSDRNSIRKLLSFVDPSSCPHGVKSFNIRAEVINNTVIFHREETSTTEIIGPNDFKGYGHEFEKAYTINELPLSSGHHRIISYRLGTLRFIIRHETDGYVDDDSAERFLKKGSPTDDLSNLLGAMTLSRSNVLPGIDPSASKLILKQGGRDISLGSTLEIKTRIHHKPLSMKEVAPQLWISQTPKLVRAYHERGKFSAPVVEDVSTDVKNWESSNQQTLKRLAGLITQIIAAVKREGHSAITFDMAHDELRLRPTKARRSFPTDLYERWKTPSCGQKAGLTPTCTIEVSPMLSLVNFAPELTQVAEL